MTGEYEPTARRIVDALRGGRKTTTFVADEAGVSENEARRHLDALADLDVVERCNDRLASEEVWRLARRDE